MSSGGKGVIDDSTHTCRGKASPPRLQPGDERAPTVPVADMCSDEAAIGRCHLGRTRVV